jgi:hypothetical protein
MSEIKCEIVQCTGEKGRRKAITMFGVGESNVQLWQKHKAMINECKASQKKFTGPKKGRFPKIDDAVFALLPGEMQDCFHCIVLFLLHVQWLYQFSRINPESNLYLIL